MLDEYRRDDAEEQLTAYGNGALALVGLCLESSFVSYCVAQAEVCPQTARLHIQGYIELTERWTFHRVKQRVFSQYMPGCHASAARGSAAQNTVYCTKPESRVPGTEPVVHGEPAGDEGETHQAGKALDRVYVDIRAGMTMEEIIDKYGFGMYVRHERPLKTAMCTWGKRRSSQPVIKLLVGPSASGKSRWVEREFPNRYRMTFGNGGNSAWFDGYNGEAVIELSEFRGQLQLSFMLDLLDRYQLKVQTKGGTVQFLADVIIITSNEEPSEWYKTMEDRDEKMKPLLRRIEEFAERPRYMTDNRNAARAVLSEPLRSTLETAAPSV